MEAKVVFQYGSLGPCAATVSADGTTICIDFAGLDGPEEVVRLVFPLARLETLQDAIAHLAAMASDPRSEIHDRPDH